MPGERFARLNDIGMLTVSETLIDTHGPFDHGWSENLFERIGHFRISLWEKICSRGPIPRAGSVVVVISGFGRSRENGDHGHGRGLLVMCWGHWWPYSRRTGQN